MKSMTKSELADKAGVSISTFSRWLRKHVTELGTMGVSPNAHILNPIAVRYVCEEYGIDV